MLRNYLKIAWRSLLKNRLFSLLNLVGLATGLAVATLLLLYVQDESRFDQYHAKANRIYRVNLTVNFDGKTANWASAPNVVGPTIKAELPGVRQQVRLLHHNFGQTAFVRSGNQKFAEKKLYWADSSLFALFDIPLLRGNARTALNAPDKVVLSRSAANRYFGTADPLGRLVIVDNQDTLEVSGVYQDFPGRSTIDADLIGSFASVRWASNPTNQSWSNASFETFLLLAPQTNLGRFEQQMAAMVAKHVPKVDQFYSLWLQPLTDIHLHSGDITNANTTRLGDFRQVQLMLLLALVILLIAGINYVNLATARAQFRFREVGLVKAIGATKRQLVGRFYLETAIMVLLALITAIGFVSVGISLINQLADKHLALQTVFSPQVGLSLLAIGAVITLLAGAYPAFYLASFSPKHLISTSFQSQSGAGLFRRSLVVIQFTASVVLIISTLLFYRQLQFIQHQKLGYEPTQVLAITTVGARTPEQLEALMNDYRSLSSVEEVCRAQVFPGAGGSGRTLSKSDANGTGTAIRTNRVTAGFLRVLGLKLLAGKTLPVDKDPKDTTVQVVMNKSAVAYLGYTPEQALGKKVTNLFGEDPTEIVGVVDDFHFDSFHQPIGAYAFHNADTENRPYLLLKMRTTNLPKTMAQVERIFRKNLTDSAFEYTFLTQFLDTLYRSEQRTAQVVLLASALAILIACLGLFGLAAFSTEQRTKEIGVRKVLGASVSSIVRLLSTDLLKLVGLAIVIGSLIAWYAMHRWLEGFAYRTTIEWWVFAVGGLLAVGIALVTVSFQSVKAALMNPVNSLRSE